MASADIAEVAEALTELGQPALQHIFVKQVRCQQHTEAAELPLLIPLPHNIHVWVPHEVTVRCHIYDWRLGPFQHASAARSELTHLQAILLALDRKDREREMVSVLLAVLHPRTLSEEQIGEGFTAIMLSCEVITACLASSSARRQTCLTEFALMLCAD